MKGTRASVRYAKALLQLSIELNVLDKVYQDMTMFNKTHISSNEFSVFLDSPIIKKDKKNQILSILFKEHFSNVTFQFIELVTKKGRESILGEVAKSFIKEYKLYKNIITAEVTTAVALDEATKNSIVNLLNANRQQVEMIETIDPSLLGGFIVKVGDHQLDQSIKNRLTQLKYEFSQNLYESKL